MCVLNIHVHCTCMCVCFHVCIHVQCKCMLITHATMPTQIEEAEACSDLGDLVCGQCQCPEGRYM